MLSCYLGTPKKCSTFAPMFQPPRNDYKDYYDQAKFRLTWNLNLMLVFILLIITELFIIIEPRFVAHYGAGALLCSLGLVYMRWKRNFSVPAYVISITGFALVCSSIFFIKDAPHFIEPFWLINIAIYVYFVLGKKWGLGFLIAIITAVGIYLPFFLQENLESVLEFSRGRFMTMSIEFAACILLMAYIINEFIEANRYAEFKYRQANELALEEKQQIDLQNKEKTVLLQEIHHRVKNNLQVITSLLRLQSQKISSQAEKENFDDAINRIMTMALIHHKMYEGENLSEIDLKDYFNSLINDLISSNSANTEVNTQLNITLDRIGNKSIVPLALIITELVTNSIKHGFVDRNRGVIGLSLTPVSNKEFEMVYFDDGQWIPSKRPNSLGLELVETFTEQLDGSHQFVEEEDRSTFVFRLAHIDD